MRTQTGRPPLFALGALRCELAKRLGLAKKDDFKLLWVTEFPQFEYSEEENRLVAMHHPFTAPMDEDIPLLDTDPAKVRAKAYDIILNGCELGGGSIRIHDPELQTKMFEALGFTEEKAKEQFGHLITAFSYGAPPHGGLAYGLDRLCMLLAGLGLHPRRHRVPEGSERIRSDDELPGCRRRQAA